MARRKKGDPVNGWLILDKPSGLTSTAAVTRVRRLFNAQKAGHAGTLDPAATGILPIALGEATKTIPFAVDQNKIYRFTIKWGVETTTDDHEGEPIATSGLRPISAEIISTLENFKGEIEQVPPQFSAIKVSGNRAYDLAREGETIDLAPRRVVVHDLKMLKQLDRDQAIFEANCAKGTYVRALARDLGRKLGCYGHVTSLRRLSVGDFSEDIAVKLNELEAAHDNDPATLFSFLHPVQFALRQIPSLNVSPSDAANLSRGQAVILRGRDAPDVSGPAYAMSGGNLIALVMAEKGCLRPFRVFAQSSVRLG